MKQKIEGVLGIVLLIIISYGYSWFVNRDVTLNDQGVELSDNGSYTGALEKFNKALKINSNDPIINFNKGKTLYFMGDYNRALVSFDNAINNHNGSDIDLSDYYSHRGATYDQLNEVDKALIDINMSLTLDENNLWGLYFDSIVKNYSDNYNYTGALNSINKYISIDNMYAEAYYQKGEIYYYAFNYTGALNEYKKVVELNNKDDLAYYKMGHIYFEDNYQLALENYKKAYELDTESLMYTFYYGYLLYKTGNIDEAKIYIEKSLLLEGGEDDEGVKLLNLLILSESSDKETIEEFIKIYYGLGADKLDELLSYLEVFEEEGYSVLEYKIYELQKEDF